jgi:hypothetical protein
MFPAKMIVDFNNPTSMAYAEVCLKSWEGVLDVEMVQCVVPATLPDKQWSTRWNRSDTEKSIICSFANLIKLIADEGQDFFILEHDAYLFPYEKETFLTHINSRKNYYYLNPGKACECQWFSHEAATDWINYYYELAQTDGTHMMCYVKGPLSAMMGLLHLRSDMKKFSKSIFPFMPRIHNEEYAHITNNLSVITNNPNKSRIVLNNDDKGITDPTWDENLMFLPACVNQIVDYSLLTTQSKKSTGSMQPSKQIDWEWVHIDKLKEILYN